MRYRASSESTGHTPPRRVEFYRDEQDRCPPCDTINSLPEDVRKKVRTKLRLLEAIDLQDLIDNQVVKHLNDNIFELRIKGKRMFGQRAFFFLTNCRGQVEAVVTEIQKRAELDFGTHIARAKMWRDDWTKRNCPRTHAR
jgi:phage-related protein